MQVKRYKGQRDDIDYPVYFTDVNIDFDINELSDNLEFIGYVNYKGEIKSWKPFIAKYEKTIGNFITYKFKCPYCGSPDCERPKHKQLADNHFFQCDYKCSKCNADGFNYYSDCFYKEEKRNLQLTLF